MKTKQNNKLIGIRVRNLINLIIQWQLVEHPAVSKPAHEIKLLMVRR